jgi:preprotein translocase subunit SecG
MYTFLLIVQTLIAASLVAVILMQRSEGGGLGVGGSSAGLMTARGAADFLTRATSVLGGLFIFLSILLAAVAGATREAPTVDTSLARQQPLQPVQQAPVTPAAPARPAGNETAPAVPLAQ